MSTTQTKTRNLPKKHDYSFWIPYFIFLVGFGALIYYGYCFGFWGRSSLLFQYLFQCNCPGFSQEWRYPKNVDVIVSACRYVSSKLAPSGRLLSVREEDSGLPSTYLLDLQTGEKILFPLPEKSGFYFLTDNLLYVSLSYEENYILDRTTGDQYPIQKFSSLSPNAYIRGYANLNLLAETLRQAKYVFFRDYNDTIVALDPDFPTSAEKNFAIDQLDIPGKNPDRTEHFLNESNIVYQTIRPDFLEEVMSPDGRFIARSDGIYLVETGQQIVEGYPLSIRGWTYDGHGVIYSHGSGRCLIRISLPFTVGTGCFGKVPQPVLLLKVPDENLSSTQTP